MTGTTGAERQRDIIDEIEARLRGLGARVRPELERAIDEVDRQARAAEAAIRRRTPELERRWKTEVRPRVDRAVEDVRPSFDAAKRRVRPTVDRAVVEAQPLLDRVLRAVADGLERLRAALDRRATRAAARAEETTAARPPAQPPETAAEGAGDAEPDAASSPDV